MRSVALNVPGDIFFGGGPDSGRRAAPGVWRRDSEDGSGLGDPAWTASWYSCIIAVNEYPEKLKDKAVKNEKWNNDSHRGNLEADAALFKLG
jgi:hypothetical protein